MIRHSGVSGCTRLRFRLWGWVALFLVMTGPVSAREPGWDDLKIRLLPDSSFALVEYTEGGKKIRHCPFKDANGVVDPEQLIYVLGTVGEERWDDPGKEADARRTLESHYDAFIQNVRRQGLEAPIDLNEAGLTRLVALPRIGPVLAVRIARKRAALGGFESIEQLKEVKGIGQGTFNGLKFYVRIQSPILPAQTNEIDPPKETDPMETDP